MFCTHCGAQTSDGTHHCPQCGAALPPLSVPPQLMPAQPAASNLPPGGIKDYLTANTVLLVCAVLCCGSLPMLATSIIGVVFSSQARSFARMGQLDEANRKARISQNMAIASGVLLAVSIILYVLILLLYGMLFTLPFLQGDFDDWFSWLLLY